MSVVELVSPLLPDECLARLQAATDRDDVWTWFGTFGSRPVVGRVCDRSVRLRKRIGYQNSYQTILRGRLERHDAGSVFRGKAGLHTFVSVFMAVWFCGVVLIGGVLAIAAIGEMLGGPWRFKGDLRLPLPLVPVLPILMLAFGVGLMRFGRWVARDEERFLVEFVADVLDVNAF